MASVDPADDDALRFIVRHYRYDPARHERRHVDVAAFDDEREFHACLARLQVEIERRRRDGEPVDPAEHVSGVVHEPGYRRRALDLSAAGRAPRPRPPAQHRAVARASGRAAGIAARRSACPGADRAESARLLWRHG